MQRSSFLQPLSHDHHASLIVAARIRRGLMNEAASGLMAAYLAHFWEEDLARHFEQEETWLAPLLHRLEAGDLADRMVREHHLIHEHVAWISASSAAEEEERRRVLADVAAALMSHVRFEERELFPALEARASEAELQDVGRRLLAEEHEPDLDWGPPFWT